jgi:TBC1 domain family member 2
MERGFLLNKALNGRAYNMQAVKALCQNGIPAEERARVWRAIFQTVHLRESCYREDIGAKDRRYQQLVRSIGEEEVAGMDMENMTGMNVAAAGERQIEKEKKGGGEGAGDRSTKLFFLVHEISEKVKYQIEIDIKRLDIKCRVLNGVDISRMYHNILSLIAQRRPSLGYVQGMADILAPFVILFVDEESSIAESSAYYCYARLMDRIQHNIISMQSELIHRFTLAVETADPGFYNHLRSSSIEVHMFAFRWFSCFFTREFRFPVLFKILDSLFMSEDINGSLLSLALALLMNFKAVLAANDFSSNILFLQNLGDREWEEAEVDMLLSAARLYHRTLMHGADGEGFIGEGSC